MTTCEMCWASRHARCQSKGSCACSVCARQASRIPLPKAFAARQARTPEQRQRETERAREARAAARLTRHEEQEADADELCGYVVQLLRSFEVPSGVREGAWREAKAYAEWRTETNTHTWSGT